MKIRFFLGILMAVGAGVSSFLGQVLQKKAVNNIPSGLKGKKYGFLFRNKTWILGLFLYLVLATVFYMYAEFLLGPVLVPGLMTSGFIALIIGSVTILHEKISFREILGIFILSMGVISLTMSKLIVDCRNIDITNSFIIKKIILFNLLALVIWAFFYFLSVKNTDNKHIYRALSAGFPYVLSNFWIFPLYVTFPLIFAGDNNFIIWLFFVLSCILLIGFNIIGIKELQQAYDLADVSLVAPIQQMPVQIAPLFYYMVFGRSFSLKSVFFILFGIVAILGSVFLINNPSKARQNTG